MALLIEVVGGPPLPPFKLLPKAMELEGPRGLCIHRAAAFVLDVPAAVLCFGTLRGTPDSANPMESKVPFIHAWAEYRGFLYAPTTIEAAGGKLFAIPPEYYYAVNEARDIYRLSRAALLKLDKRYGVKRALRGNVFLREGAGFGSTLMDAAGVPYELTDEGGIVPG